MINAEFLWKKDPVAFRVTVKGHADTGKYGEDVVCAAVSALVQTLANKVQMAMRTGGATGMIQLEDGNCWTVEAVPTDETAGDVIGEWFGFVEDGLEAIAASWPDAVEILTDGEEEEENPSGWQNLQLFAEGGGDGGAVGTADGGNGADAASTPEGDGTQSAAQNPKDVRQQVEEMLEPAGDEEDAEEGEEEPEEQENTQENRQRAFRELMQGEYRAEFEQSIQRAVQASVQQLMGDDSPLGGLLDALAEQYGTQPGDLPALMQAVQQGKKDEDYYENLAVEKGISVKLAKEMDALESELDRRRSEEERQQRQAEIQRIHAKWDAEAQRLHQMDPEFDIREAMQIPAFATILKSGADMETAYKAAYFDRIMARNTATTAQEVEKGVAERIRQRGARPAENGTHPGGAATLKTDVSKLTKAQCEELERQVRMGKTIYL